MRQQPATTRGIKAREPSSGAALARFFSSGVLRELAHTGRSATARRLTQQLHLIEKFGADMEVGAFYDAIFQRLIREYRHEYIYKNAIAEKILLGKHNLNTAFMLTEFRVDDCKADAVVLNGTSHVYEIKSEMDSFDRLDRQLAAYRKMFDFITVITTERLFDAVAERVSPQVGIRVLAEGGYQFKRGTSREAISNKANVDPLVIYNSLQRPEYLRILKAELGVELNHLPNTQIYGEARTFFAQLPPETAHDRMVEVLKLRKQTRRLAEFIMEVPDSLKAASLSIRLTNEERNRFLGLLHQGIGATFM
ncbi:MAG: sce7726 family protein [Trichloromonadaceae bacterium]